MGRGGNRSSRRYYSAICGTRSGGKALGRAQAKAEPAYVRGGACSKSQEGVVDAGKRPGEKGRGSYGKTKQTLLEWLASVDLSALEN